MQLISVRSALPEGQVALWERDHNHPGGEVFITDNDTHQVASTPAVLGAVANNILVIVPVPDAERIDASGQATAGEITFDQSEATIKEVLDAVEAGDLDAAEALEAEQAGKKRKSLIKALKDMMA